MDNNIFKNITREHIVAAITEYEKNNVSRSIATYDIFYYEGQIYPLSNVMAIANRLAGGEEINPERFTDQQHNQATLLLGRLGFDVGARPGFLTHEEFARQFFYYLQELPAESQFFSMHDWTYKGKTDIAYNTPAGAWDKPGFLFESKDYSFIIRSIWDGGHSESATYLVVESNNLKGQLANIALYKEDKYSNEFGIVTIYENYDMTIGGYGRKSREEVRNAFAKVGFADNKITSFTEREIRWERIIVDILRWSVYREEAKKLLLNEPKEEGGVNYWFIKLPAGEVYKVGETLNLSSHLRAIPNFSAIKQSDKMIGRLQDELYVLLHVDEEPVRQDEFGRLALYMDRVFIINEEIIASVNQLSFVSGLFQSSKSILPLTAIEYERLAQAITGPASPTSLTRARKSYISEVFSDTAAKDIKDQLGFESDVNALASVISYREVKPPLAIGLFGNWGSGKSFFMNKLQQKIDDLANDKSGMFCAKVLQINFNSWHYSDSNLWASLITKIFEDLEGYGNDKKNKNELNELFKQLNSTQELLQETESEKAKVESDINLLENQKKAFDDIAQDKTNELDSLSYKEIFAELKNDQGIVKDFEDLKKEYAFLKTAEIDGIQKSVIELSDFSDKFFQSHKLFAGILKGKKPFLILLFAALFALFVWWLTENTGFFKKYLGEYKTIAAAVAGFLAMYVQLLQPAIKTVNHVLVRLKSLNNTVERLKVSAGAKLEKERELLTEKIAEAQVESTKLQQKIAGLSDEKEKLEKQINDIVSGKKIIRFIESRVTDQRYINSLGTISWVRKDFEQLDKLLREQIDAKKRNKEGVEQAALSFELERIILYIDDLDRCNEETVVKVLEAIHLLLAFPLFVVVVGVDPRWMHNALNIQYSKLLSASANSNGNGHPKIGGVASSYDYLEKIFQIPFALKPMDPIGRSKLIKAQFENRNTLALGQANQSRQAAELNTPAISVSAGGVQVSVTSPADATVPAPPVTGTTAASPAASEPSVDNASIQDKEPIPANNAASQSEAAPIKPDTLQVSDEEVGFIQQLSFLIGNSPRTIKRYTNIYRIIRTHSRLELEGNAEMDNYLAVMVLLGVITGMPEEAKGLFQHISEAEGDEKFYEQLEKYVTATSKERNPLWQLFEKIHEGDSNSLGRIADITMDKFQKNIELVSRFSFHNVW